jgi:glycine/D-amino acid oxidase-like deaminating enzyme
VRHTARGWWLDEAGGVADPAPALTEDTEADVLIVGGGYTGMWTAWHSLDAGARVVLLEAGVCGHGPSGRNGGFVEDVWLSLPALRARFGDAGALTVARAAEESVGAIGAWCRDNGVDAWFRAGGHMVVSTAPAHDGVGRDAVAAAEDLGTGDRIVALSAADARARCASPRFRDGVLMPGGASVQPARLALGLRRRLVERGARIFEGTRVRRVAGGEPRRPGRPAELVVGTASGARVRAGHVVLAAGGALAAFPPLRSRLTVASSHIVLTEPVPDVIEDLGWTGGEAITDARRLLHYFRTTDDGRIAFGWAGGRLAMGARLGGRVEVDPAVAAQAQAALVALFPQLRGRAITHAWGGPIDVSPTRLPQIGTLPGGRIHFAFGYTGNGVGPSHLAGRTLALLCTGQPIDLPLVDAPAEGLIPPEPLRWLGGTTVLAALKRKEAAEERGGRADPVTRAIAEIPAKMGMTLGR